MYDVENMLYEQDNENIMWHLENAWNVRQHL